VSYQGAKSKSTRRRQLAAGAAGMGGALLAACGAAGADGERAAALSAKKLRTGTAVTWRSYIRNEPLLDEVNKLWSARHPGITLTHAFSPAPEITQKVVGEIAAGTPVDLAQSNYRDVASLQRHLVNVEPFARRDRYSLQEFVQVAVDQYRYGGGIYAMPHTFPVRIGIYNATVFAERGIKPPPSTWDAPGWTWDEFVTATKAAAPRADQSGMWAAGWDKAAGVPNLLQVLLYCNNNGGAVLSEDGKQCLLTQPRSREALQFMQDVIQRHHVAPTPEELAGAGLQPGADLFLQGKVAWGAFGPAAIAEYRRQVTFDWAAAPMPLGPGGKQRTTVMDGSAWMMLSDAKNQEETWELMQVLTSPEYQRAAGQLQGYVPARRAVMAEYAGSEPPKHFKMTLDASEKTYLVPKSPWIAEADAALAPLLRELWTGNKGANVVAEEAKRLLDPILQKEFSFKGA
jgi:multiple sugar transport system substrate-binding protein